MTRLVPKSQSAPAPGSTGGRAPVGDELGSIAVGPATCVLVTVIDGEGTLRYKIAGHAPRIILLSPKLAGRRVGVIDNLRSVWTVNADSLELIAVTGFSAGLPHSYLFGDLWGGWVDTAGRAQRAADPMAQLEKVRMHIDLNPDKMQIRVEFNINALFREAFTSEARQLFYTAGDHSHRIGITFDLPAGRYVQGKVIIEEGRTGQTWGLPVDGFPLRWPVKGAADPRATAAPRAKTEGAPLGANGPERAKFGAPTPLQPPPQPQAQTPPNSSDRAKFGRAQATPVPPSPPPRATEPPPQSSGRARFQRPPQPTPAPEPPPLNGKAAPGPAELRAKFRPASTPPSAPPPVDPVQAIFGPRTAEPAPEAKKAPVRWNEISNEEAVRLIQAERDHAAQWKMIDANLGAMARPDRCYALAARFPDLFMENTPSLAPARLKSLFGMMPCAILAGVMHDWSVNQVMGVLDENPDKERLVDWLRHRELERLLELSGGEPTNQETARRDLNVDRNADAAAIKKAWRTLLGFLNADHGRNEERAIHRKKDEIAKRLQVARNILLKGQ